MSEARALTNFSGNAVATLVIGNWVEEIDRDQAKRVLAGEDPFDETDHARRALRRRAAGRALAAGSRARPAEPARRRPSAGRRSALTAPTRGAGDHPAVVPRPATISDTARDTDDGEPADATGKLRTGPDRRRWLHRPHLGAGERRAGHADDQPGDGVHAGRAPGAGADRVAALRGDRRWRGSCAGSMRSTAEQSNDLAKWVYLANLRDRNEVLFYRLLTEHISEMLPVVYTPTVGLAIERFIQEFRRPRGVYLSVDHPEDVETALRNTGLGRGRRRPAGGHRLRGHPGHRRPGRRRHRDLHRQARRVHRGGRDPPVAGAAGGAGHGHRQPAVCSTTRCTWASGTPGSATTATTT